MSMILNVSEFKVLIDDADEHIARSHRWRVSKGCAVRTECCDGRRRLVYMHRVVIGALPGQVVDHINGNALDNRRSNLRICTQAENLRNRRRSIANQSGFKGVYLDPRPGKTPWRAQIKFEGKKHNLGSFDTPEEAHAAYAGAAKRLHGEFARPE